MSAITTHVLDTAVGRPAAGVHVRLEVDEGERFVVIGEGDTDADGRLRTLLPDGVFPKAALHRLSFEVAPHFARRGVATFFTRIEIAFIVREPAEHYHVPLLVSPFGYSTYRGS